MPLPDTSTEFKKKVLSAGGYNPDEYDMDDEGNVSRSIKLQPAVPITNEPVPELGAQVSAKPPAQSTAQSTALQAGLHSAAASAIPTMTGLGGTAAASWLLGPEVGLPATIIAGLAGGIGGGWLGQKAQNAVLPDAIQQQLAQEHEEHPIASTVGGFVPSLPFFNPIKGAMELPAFARSGGKLLSRGTTALTDAEQGLLANTAANVGVAGGQNIAEQTGNGQPFDWSQLGVNLAGAGLLNSPTGLGERVFKGFGTSKEKVVAGQPKETDVDVAQVATKPPEYNTPSPFSGEAPTSLSGLAPSVLPENAVGGKLSAYPAKVDKMSNYAENKSVKEEELNRMEGEGGQAHLEKEEPNQRLADFIKAQKEMIDEQQSMLEKHRANEIKNTLENSQLQQTEQKPAEPFVKNANGEETSIPTKDYTGVTEQNNVEAEAESATDLAERREEAKLSKEQKPKYQEESELEKKDVIGTVKSNGAIHGVSVIDAMKAQHQDHNMRTGWRYTKEGNKVKWDYDPLPEEKVSVDDFLNRKFGIENPSHESIWDSRHKYQEEPNDELALRNAPKEYQDKVLALAKKRGISVQEARKLINLETGKEVLGQYEGDKRLATLSTEKAQLDTPIHEVTHGYFSDLEKSTSAGDNHLAKRALEIFKGDRDAAEEALVRKLGVEGVKRTEGDLYGTKKEKFNSWFEDFKSRWKHNLGMSSDEDVIRHLSARTFHDAPYGTRGELQGRARYNALVAQHKDSKNEEQRVAIRQDIEDIKNKNGGMPPKEQSEPALKKADVRGRFATDVEKELAKEKPFGVVKDKNGKLPILTLKGKMEKMIPAGELAALRESGLDEAIKQNRDDAGKIDLAGVAKWVKENGPRVEVRKFGERPIDSEFAKIKQAHDELYHKLETMGVDPNKYGYETKAHPPDMPDYLHPSTLKPEQQKVYDEMMERASELDDLMPEYTDEKGQTNWQSISPKSESDMKGYTEIAVIKPKAKTVPFEKWAKDNGFKDDEYGHGIYEREIREGKVQDYERDKFPSSHNFPPNTISWVRGHMETDAKGKKTFLIHEVQSDWAQRQKRDSQDVGYPLELSTPNDPLLTHYESLALKAAIEHARSEGADSVAISDAPTAMMTEGHDRGKPFGTELTQAEYDKWRPSQEKGMRAAYDSRLPNIAKKLTDSEGEMKEFGEHKMAYNSYGEEVNPSKREPRKDLIFRNPDGTPKTSITARVYPIEQVAKRLEANEPMSLFHTRYQDKGALRPEDVSLGNRNKLSAKQKEGNTEDDTIHLRLTRSESDAILAKDGARAKPAVTAIANQQSRREEYTAKYDNKIKDTLNTLSDADKTALEKTFIAENAAKTSYRDDLNPKQQDAYDSLRGVMKQMQEDRIEAKQPVKSFSEEGKPIVREAKIDPYYWPNQISPEVAQTLKEAPNSPKAEALREDWIEFQKENHIPKEQAQEMLDGMLSSYSKTTPNLAHFRGVDIEQGHGLPQSFMRPGLERNLERYVKRFSNSRAFHDAIESKPEVAPLFNIKKSPWGEDYDAKIKPLQSTEAHDAFQRITGADYNPEHGKIRSIERIGSSLILGPATSLHIYASTVANALTHAMPHEVAGMVSEMATGIKEGFAHAKEAGILGRKSFKQITSNFLDAHSTAQERLNALSDGIAKISGRDALGNLAKAQAQIGGEYLVKSRIELAKLGDTKVAKQAQRFMKQVDPYWNAEKEYSPSDIKRMGTNFARSLHGHSSATQPNWMLKDNIVQPFVSLMSWNIAQTNAFMKNVYTPAVRDGNFTPLLMSTLGATLGGYVIKEAREKLMNKKSPIPSFSELAASDKGLAGNIPLVAYNLMAMTSFAGLGGILSTAARTAFDAAYKNPAQGAVFPLDEVVSNTARTLTHAYGALANSKLEDYPLIGSKATADLLRENIQLARIGLSWADESGVLGEARERKKKLTAEEGDLRRFKVAEGMPYEDQSSIDESNPYFNLARKKFQKTGDLQEAMTQLPSLIDRAFEESNGNIEVLKNKLSTLKETSYPSMPSPERTPMTFWKYVEYLNKTEGVNKASQRVSEYMQNNMINKLKGAMVPSF